MATEQLKYTDALKLSKKTEKAVKMFYAQTSFDEDNSDGKMSYHYRYNDMCYFFQFNMVCEVNHNEFFNVCLSGCLRFSSCNLLTQGDDMQHVWSWRFAQKSIIRRLPRR